MQDKWRKAENCTERDETSTESGWRRRSMQDKWRKAEHCTERDEISTVWVEKTEHARQVEESGELYGKS